MEKRIINDNDIEFLLDFLKPMQNIPIKTAISVCEYNKKKLSMQLEGLEIYPEILNKLKKQIIKQYYSTIISPGESIGITCAQSIGEKGTQSTLNTFHSCGVSDRVVNAGVPRLQELLNSTKIPKTINTKIFFKNKPCSINDLRKEIGTSIVGLTILKITKEVSINLNKKNEAWYPIFFILHPSERERYISSCCITLILDIDKMYEYKLSTKNICNIIEKEFLDSYCIFSPPQINKIDIFFNMENIEIPEHKLKEYKVGTSKQIYMEEIAKPNIENMVVFGIPEISEIYYVQNQDKEWYAETDGGNLPILLANPKVDSTRTISNNCWEIYKTLGIEAVRQYLIEEFSTIVEGINECHIKLLVDRMTYSGTISAISRYTMRQDPSGVFSRMSFEESVVNALDSAACGDVENTKGISASIVCGKRSSIGSGMVELLMDLSFFIPPFKQENIVDNTPIQ